MAGNQDKTELEFVSPFSLLNCTSRLEGRHEKANPLAFRWQNRTHIRIRQVDGDAYAFTMKRVEKTAFYGLTTLVSVKGKLQKLDENRTLVTAKEKMSWFWLSVGSLLLGGVLGFILFGSRLEDSQIEIQDVILLAAASIAGITGTFLFSWIYARNQTLMLMGILKESLGYQDDLATEKSPR